MGIFDYFKKKKVFEEEQVESVSFENVEGWLENKKKISKLNEEQVLAKIEKRLDEFYVSVKEKLIVLEMFDLESKKEHERVKILVRQGLDKYIGFVHTLLKDLNTIEKNNLEKFAQDISKAFVFFEKMSARGYERATYLVGDEMAAVREEIKKFYNGIAEMFKESEVSVKNLRDIKDIELKLEGHQELGKKIKETKKEIEVNNQRIEKARENVEKLEEEAKNIKEHKDYISNLKKGEEVSALKVDLDREIIKLKNLIDFKKLIGIIHTNERELEAVKEYRDHFVSEFFKDGGQKIIDLLKEVNMKNSSIDAQVLLIGKKKAELKDKRAKVAPDVSVAKFKEVGKIEDKIKDMETEKVRIERYLEGFNIKSRGLKSSVMDVVESVEKRK